MRWRESICPVCHAPIDPPTVYGYIERGTRRAVHVCSPRCLRAALAAEAEREKAVA